MWGIFGCAFVQNSIRPRTTYLISHIYIYTYFCHDRSGYMHVHMLSMYALRYAWEYIYSTISMCTYANTYAITTLRRITYADHNGFLRLKNIVCFWDQKLIKCVKIGDVTKLGVVYRIIRPDRPAPKITRVDIWTADILVLEYIT